MSWAGVFPRTRLVLAISILGLIACGAWVAATPHDRIADPFSLVLLVTAALASLALLDLDEALFVGGSLIANVCAIAVLGPASAAAVALAGEIAVLVVDRYRWSAFPMNLLGGVAPNMAGAALFQSVAPEGGGLPYYLVLFGIAWLAVLLNGALVTSLVVLERSEALIGRLRALRPLIAPIALNMLVAIGAVAVYRNEGLDGAVFVLGALLVFAYCAKQLGAQQRQLARNSALAESRGRLVVQVLEAEDRERRVLADTLHDKVIQQLLFLRQDIADEGASSRRALLGALDAAVAQLRGAIRVTHPSVLDRIGLGAALRAVAEDHAERGRIEVSVTIDSDLTTRYDRLLFSTARELLMNVVKHADAGHVSVKVSMTEGTLRLAVIDDGIGWDLRDVRSLVEQGHFGLAAVADRIESVGGSLQVTRQRTSGTAAIVLLPLRPPAPPVSPANVLEANAVP